MIDTSEMDLETILGRKKEQPSEPQLSPEIMEYLQGKQPDRFSDARMQQLSEEARKREESLAFPELVANLGSAIAGTGGLAATPAFDKMRQNAYAPMAEAKAAGEEHRRRMNDILDYLARKNPQDDEYRKRMLDLREIALGIAATGEGRKQEYQNWRINEQFPTETGIKKEGQKIQRENLAERSGHNLWSETHALAKDLDPLVEINYSIDKLNKIMPEKGDIPGIGPIDRLAPDFMLSNRASEIQSVVATLRNAILKLRSGGTVTEGEADRDLEELKLDKYSTDRSFRQVFRNMAEKYARIARNVQAGTSERAAKSYRERGGEELNAVQQAAPQGSLMTPEQRKRLYELRAKYGK